MALKTAGVEVYYEDDGDVKSVGCLIDLSVDGDEVEVLDKSCLGALDKSYEAGVRDAGSVTMGIRFDPGVDAHKFFYDKYENRENVNFTIALSDGDAEPTFDEDFEALGRTLYNFEAFFTSVPFTFESEGFIEAELQLQKTKPAKIEWA